LRESVCVREREREMESVCVCVRERERERERVPHAAAHGRARMIRPDRLAVSAFDFRHLAFGFRGQD